MADSNNVKSIFLAASEKHASERSAFLDDATGSDTALRVRVEALLKAHDDPDSFLNEAAAKFGATIDLAAPESPLAERPGTVIGPYKLLQQIGEGGMGVVFMAEQAEPIQRTVALKIIKPGMDTRQVIARFEAERQAVAMMDHPNIAKVLDAGTTESGRPYFVMELVKGVPITKYCDEKHLTLRARLELFMQVCQAVQHAHQKGIIHRDIKPNNVLVAEYDNHAVPKVIDFGVAKATAQRLTERTIFTEFGQVLGTMEYMSPEQSKFNQLDIDTRSDIYSLGVLLYELLTGSTPFERLREAVFDEVLRIIREEEPPKPSTRLSTSETLPSIAANRHTEPARLRKDVQGELDWIVMRSLEKDRQRRYQTASAMSEDIQHYLTDQPVEACPPSTAYRLKKFLCRNKPAVLAGSAIIAALAIGLILASVGFIHARHEADRADHEASNARMEAALSGQVAQFLKEMLASAGPNVARGRDATLLREVLAKASNRIDTDLQGQSEIQGDLWFTVAKTYSEIGDYGQAIQNVQRAVDCYRRAPGKDNAKLAKALGALGLSQSFKLDVNSGIANSQAGLDMARRCGDPQTIEACLTYRAQSFDGQGVMHREAVPYWREALEIRKKLGGDPVALARCMYGLAVSLGSESEGLRLMPEVLDIYREHLGTDHPQYAVALFVWGQKLLTAGRIEEAETVLHQTYDLYHKLFDKKHPYQPFVFRFLFEALVINGKVDEAASAYQRECETLPESPSVQFDIAISDIADHLRKQDRYSEFEPLLTRLAQGLTAASSDTFGFRLQGYASGSRNEWAAAVESFSKAVESTKYGDDSSLHDLALALLRGGRLEEYHLYCHKLLGKINDSASGTYKVKVAQVVVLAPLPPEDEARALEVAFRVKHGPNAWPKIWSTMRLYRKGEFRSAIQSATDSLACSEADVYSKAVANYLKAAAHASLHEENEAKAAFQRANELADSLKPEFRAGREWRDFVWLPLLRDEAASLIGTNQRPDNTAIKDQ